MGCYLAIGLKIKTAIGKKEISKHLDKMPLEDIFKEIEKEYHLEDIYVRQETEDYYVYTLDEKLLDKEFIPFLEKFYQLRYQDGDNYDAPNVLEELNSIPDTPSRLALLNKKSFQTYQMGSDNDYHRVNGSWIYEVPIYNTYAILSLDGKIIMECYNEVFNFLRRCIIAQLSEFKLSKALSIWIDG